MTVTLPKGGNLLLVDEAPGIKVVRVGLGWSQAPGSGAAEMDGLISLVSESSPGGQLLLAHQVPNPEESMGASPVSGRVVGDAEKLVVTLDAVPQVVNRMLFGVSIYDAANRRQTFRSVRGAYIRLVNDANGIEIARYTLDPETGAEIAMVFGELYRNPRGWKFRAVGQGYAAGLRGIAGVSSGDLPTARPVEVNSYLRRTSSARSHRSLTEHLNPPKPVAPAPLARPPQPVAKPSPPSTPPAKASPVRTSLSHPARHAAPPSAPPAQHAAPPPAPPPQRPAARSFLDLSEPDQAPVTNVSPSASRVVFGEHSSRYRQRMEHVSALDDGHPATTWTEVKRGSGAMTVTLRWEPLRTASGLPRPSDLQLGSFWQAADRSAGVVQLTGNAISAPGALGPRQVLRLGRRDEREGQILFVDLAALPSFRRFFAFAYGQHGSPEWSKQRPVLTVDAPTGEQLTIRPGEAPPGARLCVIASFHVAAGDLIIRRENAYFDGLQAEAAARYGWTLDWNPDGMTLRTAP